MPEHSLDQFPAWVQTVSYIGALLVGLGVASHGYFKAWIKKIAPGKTDVLGGTTVSAVMVMDRSAIELLTATLNRVDTTLRSVQDDLKRSEDRMERIIDAAEKILRLGGDDGG